MMFGTRRWRTLGEPSRIFCQGKGSCWVIWEPRECTLWEERETMTVFLSLEPSSPPYSSLETILLSLALSIAKVFIVSRSLLSLQYFLKPTYRIYGLLVSCCIWFIMWKIPTGLLYDQEDGPTELWNCCVFSLSYNI